MSTSWANARRHRLHEIGMSARAMVTPNVHGLGYHRVILNGEASDLNAREKGTGTTEGMNPAGSVTLRVGYPPRTAGSRRKRPFL
jgi:hypothetical protein